MVRLRDGWSGLPLLGEEGGSTIGVAQVDQEDSERGYLDLAAPISEAKGSRRRFCQDQDAHI